MYKRIWSENVKSLLEKRGLTMAQAADILGTSRQYLSAILAEGEPQSAKESIIENLHWLLHTDPGKLYSLPGLPGELDSFQAQPRNMSLPDLSPVETAILAEQSFRGGHYRRAHGIAEMLLELYEAELVPAAVAQAELLSGKSACLAGNVSNGIPRLTSALSFYRKRLSAQPEKFFSLCIDSSRYLGLALYLQGDYPQSIKRLTTACHLAARYPALAEELSARLEEVATNLLRAATRQGRLAELAEAAAVVMDMADKCGFVALRHYVTLELTLAQYPGKIVAEADFPADILQRDDVLTLFRKSSYGFESLQGYTFALILYLMKDSEGLSAVAQAVQGETRWSQSGAQSLVAMFLALLGGALPNPAVASATVSEPSVFSALQQAGQAQSLGCSGSGRLAMILWQEALGTLRDEREFPLYILTLYWYLRSLNTDDTVPVAPIWRRLLELACATWQS